MHLSDSTIWEWVEGEGFLGVHLRARRPAGYRLRQRADQTVQAVVAEADLLLLAGIPPHVGVARRIVAQGDVEQRVGGTGLRQHRI